MFTLRRHPPQKRRDENSVRVTNLSEDVSEDDLRELFGAFGQVQRVFIAKDRETGECGAGRKWGVWIWLFGGGTMGLLVCKGARMLDRRLVVRC